MSFLSGDLETVFEDSRLRIARRRGDKPNSVVVAAFAGVQGAFDGLPVEEFAASLGRATTPHEAWFIVDKTRGWYNATLPAIETVLRRHLAGRRVITLGNSMGGFGALLFGERLNAAVVVAICPQYAIDPAIVPFESRWRDFAAAIPAFNHPTCLPEHVARGTTRLVLAGATHEADMAHARMIQARMGPDDAVFALTGCGHDVARTLKQRGLLVAVLDAALAPGASAAAIAAILDEAAIDYQLSARNGSSEASKSG